MNTLTQQPNATAKYLLDLLGSSIDADTFCKSIVHHLHKNYGAIASFITRLEKDAKIRWVGRYGYESDTSNVAMVSVWDKSASARAILSGQPVVIADPSIYQKLFGDPHLEHANGIGLVVLPLHHHNQVVGSLGISFATTIDETICQEDTFAMLSIGASAFLMRLLEKKESATMGSEPMDHTSVTNRDIQILTLMDEGMTHYAIGRVLDLSESTIKQCSSALYKKLGVSKKSDAIDQAKLLRLI